jgi:hypothetical protein
MRGLFGALAVCALFSTARSARANPELRAELGWHGTCDDAEDLVRQVRARGVELELQSSPLPIGVDAAGVVHVDVTVRTTASSGPNAEIQLRNDEGEELRRVQASACGDLRSAVAWVLVVLAQQRAAEHRAPSATESGASATAAFPDIASSSVPTHDNSSTPEPAPSPQTGSPPRARPRDARVSSWGLGCSLVAAYGLVPAPAFGPTLFGRYRSEVSWLPVLQLSVQRLVTFGFESNGTSISLTRDAARLGAWVPLLGSAVELGFAAEAGRLAATGSGGTLEHGSSDSTFWYAFGVPLRFSIPLIGRHLRAEVSAELDYSPVPYTFRYGSGDTLTSTSPFEGRGQLGLVSLF